MNLVHDIYHNRCPGYMKTFFTRTRDLHNYNTRGSEYNFVVPKANTIITKTFYYQAIKAWNALPVSLRGVENKDTFKRQLKHHLCNRARDLELQTTAFH